LSPGLLERTQIAQESVLLFEEKFLKKEKTANRRDLRKTKFTSGTHLKKLKKNDRPQRERPFCEKSATV
jgi:hypothetical protein